MFRVLSKFRRCISQNHVNSIKSYLQPRLLSTSAAATSLNVPPQSTMSPSETPNTFDPLSSTQLDPAKTAPVNVPVIEHVFIRFDYKSSFFDNFLQVSLPENTPVAVVELINNSLRDALKDRPTGRDYSNNKLSAPEFVQTGVCWNRYIWTLCQREVEGSLDPYTLQGIVLDALTNQMHAKIVGNTSLGRIGHESYTYIVGVPVHNLDYSYKKF